MTEYIPAKTIVTKTKNTAWFGTDYNMNIYKGCCHGCICCDSRSECCRIDVFGRVRAKENAREIIRNVFRRFWLCGSREYSPAYYLCRFIYPAFGMTLRQNRREYYYKKLYHLFAREYEKHGLLYRMEDITYAYKQSYGGKQLNFPDMI